MGLKKYVGLAAVALLPYVGIAQSPAEKIHTIRQHTYEANVLLTEFKDDCLAYTNNKFITYEQAQETLETFTEAISEYDNAVHKLDLLKEQTRTSRFGNLKYVIGDNDDYAYYPSQLHDRLMTLSENFDLYTNGHQQNTLSGTYISDLQDSLDELRAVPKEGAEVSPNYWIPLAGKNERIAQYATDTTDILEGVFLGLIGVPSLFGVVAFLCNLESRKNRTSRNVPSESHNEQDVFDPWSVDVKKPTLKAPEVDVWNG